MNEEKPWWGSKLNWVGIGLLAAGLLEFAAKDAVTPEWLDHYLMMGAGVLIVLFRGVTSKPIANRIL